MDRYFFDFDGVPDQCGIELPSAKRACAEALISMPEYVAEKLERDGGKAEMTCLVRGGGASYKIVMTMHIEDERGGVVEPASLLREKA